MYNEYPYLNLNDLNLDFTLRAIKEMRNEVTNFVSINAIKYADPIQWSIIRQYEKNTIVIDPVTGTAYISVAPVPAGVALTREEFWTVVFDLGSFVTRAAQNFTSRWESETTLTATFATPAGSWLVWGDVLYKALVNITAGDSYVVGSNIEHFTIEELYTGVMQLIADNYDAIVEMIGNLNDLTTSTKDNIVAAINELVLGLSDEVQARQDGDDALNLKVGDLDDLATSDKSSIVNAINDEVQARQDADDALQTSIAELINSHRAANVLNFGADPTGANDSAAAFQAAIDTGIEFIYIPAGRYKINSVINLAFTNKVFGDAVNTTMFEFDPTLPYLFNCAGRHTFSNFTVISNAGDNYAFYNDNKTGITFNNVWLTGGSFSATELKTKYLYCVGNDWTNIVVENVLCDCGIYDNGFAFYFVSDGSHDSNDLVFENCFIDTVMATGNVNVGAIYFEKCRKAHINSSLVRSGNTIDGTASRAVACVDTTAIISCSSIRNGCTLIDNDSELENESSHIHQLVQLGYYIYYDNDIYQGIYSPLKHNRFHSTGGGAINRLYNGRITIETDAGAVGTHNVIGLYYPYDADHTTHTFDVTIPKVLPFGSRVIIGVTDGTGVWGFGVTSDFTNLDYELQLVRYSDANTESAATRVTNWTGERFIMRMKVSGGNVLFYASPDATHWYLFRTIPISSMIDVSTVTGFLIGVDNYVSNGTPIEEIAVVNQSR